MEILNVKIDRIRPDKNQPRQKLDHDRIADIAQSIKTEGIINPIEIDQDYVIVTGEMRWRSAKVAGLATVPCKMLKIAPRERFRRQVIENIHHNTMSDWDTAQALNKLIDGSVAAIRSTKQQKGGNADRGIRELSRQIGKSPGYIGEKLAILNTSPEFKKAVKKGLEGTFIRAIYRTPQVFKLQMEKKILSGYFKQTEHAIEMASALRRTPNKSTEILKTKNIGEVLQLSPRMSDVVAQALTPPQELAKIKKELVLWLTNHTPDKTIKINAPQIILTLDVIVRAIQDWGKKARS